MDGGAKGKGDGQKVDKNTPKQEKKKKDKGNPQTAEQSASQKGAAKEKLPSEDRKPDHVNKELAEPEAGVQQLSKAEAKRQRREKQEAQRLAKGKAKEGGSAATKKEAAAPPRVPDNIKADLPDTQKKVAKKLEKQQIPQRTTAQRKIQLFNHLVQYEREALLTRQFSSIDGVHPAIRRLGLQYAEGVICGSNARCVALLEALKMMISDYTTPPKEDLCRDLAAKMKPNISFLNHCRPKSVSMGNAIKHIKWHISQTPGTMKDSEAKEQLKEAIDDFSRERITLAATAISHEASSKIADGDVILIYSCSSLIRRVLCDAHKQGKKFRVIVADSRPKLEGKEALRRLVKEGIKCSYVLINAVSYVMMEATKVLLGAHGLLANGFVMSRVGTSLISLIAKSSNVPVLVCCETYKFSERVQTDSFVFNELGDPDDLVDIGKKNPYLWDWRDFSSLTLLNLVYDFTPPEFITMVITELGMIPCTSVPVVLRMKQALTYET